MLCISIILVIAPLYQNGLFIDGLLYKTVSHNFFSGESSFWKMKFNDVSMNPFYEQPPLFFFVTGSIYSLLGDSFIIDKTITLLFLILSFILIHKICRLLFSSQQYFVIVILLLLSIPVFCWAFVNQVIETFVVPLSLGALYVFLISVYRQNLKWLIPQALLFSGIVILLFLTKGFQSCFIITLPFLYCVIFRSSKSFYFGILSSIAVLLILYFILMVHEPSSQWFHHYLQKRLLASLNNVGATTGNRFEIIIRIFTELLFPVCLLLILAIVNRKKKKNTDSNKMALVLLMVGIFGSFPFAITLEQRGFYLVPSFPFYVLSVVLFYKDHFFSFFEKLENVFNRKMIRYLCLALFLGSLGYWIISPTLYKRDENLVEDLKLINPFINRKDTISIDSDSWNDTALQSYLYMQKKINVISDYSQHYYIHDRGHNTTPNSNYVKVSIPTRQYDLYVSRNIQK